MKLHLPKVLLAAVVGCLLAGGAYAETTNGLVVENGVVTALGSHVSTEALVQAAVDNKLIFNMEQMESYQFLYGEETVWPDTLTLQIGLGSSESGDVESNGLKIGLTGKNAHLTIASKVCGSGTIFKGGSGGQVGDQFTLTITGDLSEFAGKFELDGPATLQFGNNTKAAYSDDHPYVAGTAAIVTDGMDSIIYDYVAEVGTTLKVGNEISRAVDSQLSTLYVNSGAAYNFTESVDVSCMTIGSESVTFGADTTTSNLTLAAGAGTIKYSGNFTIGGYITVVDVLGLDKTEDQTPSYSEVDGNGYISTTCVLFENKGDGDLTLPVGAKATVGGQVVDLTTTDDGKTTFSIAGTSGVYYVNSGTVDYGTPDSTIYSDSTTGIALNGGSLNMTQSLTKNAEAGGISILQSGATVTLGKDVVLEDKNVSFADSKTTGQNISATLAGSGTYVMSYSEANIYHKMRFTLGDEWKGTVLLDNTYTYQILYLNNYGNANSVVELKGALKGLTIGSKIESGESGDENPITSNIRFSQAENGDSAIYLNSSYSYNVNFTGTISGNGFIERDKVLASSYPTITNKLKFTGDVSQWTGGFRSSLSCDENTVSQIEFSGKATEINASVISTGNSKVDVDIDNDNGVTVNEKIKISTTDKARSGKLTVSGAGAKTFNAAVEVGNMTLAGGTVTLNADTTLTSGVSTSTTEIDIKAASLSLVDGASLKLSGDGVITTANTSTEAKEPSGEAVLSKVKLTSYTTDGDVARRTTVLAGESAENKGSITGAKITVGVQQQQKSRSTTEDLYMLSHVELENTEIDNTGSNVTLVLDDVAFGSGSLVRSANTVLALNVGDVSIGTFTEGDPASLTITYTPEIAEHLTMTGNLQLLISSDLMRTLQLSHLETPFTVLNIDLVNVLNETTLADLNVSVVNEFGYPEAVSWETAGTTVSVTFNPAIPEPATTTLSLLALAALAARRRRSL